MGIRVFASLARITFGRCDGAGFYFQLLVGRVGFLGCYLVFRCLSASTQERGIRFGMTSVAGWGGYWVALGGGGCYCGCWFDVVRGCSCF